MGMSSNSKDRFITFISIKIEFLSPLVAVTHQTLATILFVNSFVCYDCFIKPFPQMAFLCLAGHLRFSIGVIL